MLANLATAGERVELCCAPKWLSEVLTEGTGGQAAAGSGTPDVRVSVEDSAAPFDIAGWEVLTRGAWRRPGQVVIRDACSSGLDLLATAAGPTLEIVARWRPPAASRAAATVLRARSRLLLRAVLLQYPALWWSQRRGRAPLHASVCTVGQPAQRTVLIAGPGGVGKSTLVNAELAAGGVSTCDNLCVSDGHAAWGLLEPRRVPAGRDQGGGQQAPRGRRMPHGRREAPWPSRAESLVPDCLLVLRRGSAATPTVTPCSELDAARILTAGTYMAGELRRYWAFAATLALGTGAGDSHPPVESIARTLSEELPCLEVVLPSQPGTSLRTLLSTTTEAEVS